MVYCPFIKKTIFHCLWLSCSVHVILISSLWYENSSEDGTNCNEVHTGSQTNKENTRYVGFFQHQAIWTLSALLGIIIKTAINGFRTPGATL